MMIFAHPYAAATDPNGSLVARSDSHSSFGTLAVIAVVTLLVLLLIGGAARPAIVVVEQPVRFAGSFLGFLVIAVAIGILWFAYIGPGRGSA